MSDVPAIVEQYAKELKSVEAADITIPEDQQKQNNSGEDKENKKENDKKSRALKAAIQKVLNEDSWKRLIEAAQKEIDKGDNEDLEPVQVD